MDQIRGASRIAVTALEDSMDYLYASTDETESVEYNLQLLAQAMSAIEPQEASLLKMKYQDGLDVRQIATQLNQKDSAVKMRLKRSRDKVRQLCGESAFQ